MRTCKTLAAVLLAASLSASPLVGCTTESTERWATTENTNVDIDWNKVNEAYKVAEGPEDLEKRINDIYTGDEVISIAVHDLDAKVQVVTGFFDKNQNGGVEADEKIFTIKREVTGEGAQVQTHGHGHYAGYASPMLSLVSGMLLGSMMMSAMSPGYSPRYTQPYATSAARTGELRNQRAPRATKASGTGKSYNSAGRSPRGQTGGRRMGGGRFGIRRPAGAKPPRELTA
jgi:hypothetical protein